MSTWADRVRSHVVWQQLDALGPIIDQALGREDPDPSIFEGLTRLKAVLAFVGRRLSTSDSLLIQPAPLDSLASTLQNATSEVQSFISNGSPGHIVNANSHADAALTYLAQINLPVTTADLVGLRESADSYRAAFEANLRAVRTPVEELQSELAALHNRLADLTTEVASEKQRLSSLASEHQSQFSAAQESRNKDHLEAQSARQEKIAALLSEYSQKLGDQNAEFSKQREALLKAHQDDLASLTATYRDGAVTVLTDIENHRQQVEKLVGVIGNLGVTSGYQKTAKEAQNTARVWQLIALAALAAIIVVAYKAFLPLVQGSFTWEGFAGRVFVSLTVGVLAAYAISQADKYQQVERRSRKLALELEALGPFLAALPQDKQEEFKLRIGDRTFGTSEDLIDRHSSDSPKSVFDVALKSKELRALIVEIIKATRGAAG